MFRILSVCAAGLLVAGCNPRPITPVDGWTRVAPENTGFSYEKMRRLLNELDGNERTLLIARFGYLIWDDGDIHGTIDDMPAALRGTLDGTFPSSGFDLPEQLARADDFTAAGLAMQALVLKRDGKWDGSRIIPREVVRAALEDGGSWTRAEMKYDAGDYYYAGDDGSLWVIICPEQSILMVAVADENKKLPPVGDYADALIDSIRAMQ